MNQLSMFGPMPDQNTFQSEKWGTLTFFPTKSDKWTDTCRHCLLFQHPYFGKTECDKAPCLSKQRSDHKNGYFSIHNYPISKHHGNN